MVIDVGGVGYVVSVTAQSSYKVGERADLHIYTAVRDDAIQLFGFEKGLDKQVFDMLIGVPSVGPAKAMGILNTPTDAFIELVARREPAKLAKLPGLGKKTAERIILDLADKLAALAPQGVKPAAPPVLLPQVGPASDLVSALLNLGYKQNIAEQAAAQALKKEGEKADLSVLLKSALGSLKPS